MPATAIDLSQKLVLRIARTAPGSDLIRLTRHIKLLAFGVGMYL
jgi:hypothetical protein